MFFSLYRYTASIILLLLIQASVCYGEKPTRWEASALRSLSTQSVPGVISVSYDVVHLGGNVYRYVYSITNNGSAGSAAPMQLFDILFDTNLYQEPSLQIVTASSLQVQWSEELLLSLPGVPATYDALTLRGGIPAGSSVTGFSVQFVWLGPGVPGSQPFQIFDPTTFQVLQTGHTVNSSSPVPDPTGAPAASTISLILIGLGLAVTATYQARAHNRRLRAGAGTASCRLED